MREIKKDLELIKFNGVDETIVYKGGLSELVRADELEWRKEKCEFLGDIELLKLSEIADQIGKGMITIFIQEPLKGTIYQYGNYGASWWEIGATCGYA